MVAIDGITIKKISNGYVISTNDEQGITSHDYQTDEKKVLSVVKGLMSQLLTDQELYRLLAASMHKEVVEDLRDDEEPL